MIIIVRKQLNRLTSISGCRGREIQPVFTFYRVGTIQLHRLNSYSKFPRITVINSIF